MTKEYIKLLMPELTRHKHLKQTDTESQSVSHLPVQATPVRVSLGFRLLERSHSASRLPRMEKQDVQASVYDSS